MTSKIANLTFTDEDDIASVSAVEQILNTEVVNTLAGDDIIIGTTNDYGFENISVLSTDDGNDTIMGIENLDPEFESSYGFVNSSMLNADADNDILTGTSRDDGITNSGALNADEDNDIITGTASGKSSLSISSLTIHSITCVQNGADGIGADDTYIEINGTKIWGDYDMKRRQTRSVNSNYSPPNSGTAWVELFDYDWIGRDDSMGGFTALNTDGQVIRQRVSGSGSSYDVYYSAWAA